MVSLSNHEVRARWIPACAGMTWWRTALPVVMAGLDPSTRPIPPSQQKGHGGGVPAMVFDAVP